ncbi:hypothetical protein PG988_016010 [Apiospora saccharicola]
MSNIISLILFLLASIRSTSAAALPWWRPARDVVPVQNHLAETVYITKTMCDTTTLTYFSSTSTSTSTTPTAEPFSAQDITPTSVAPTPPTTTEPPTLLTISLVNSHTAAISTTHNSNRGAPPPASGSTQPGTLAAGATAAIAVPTNWAGIISVNDAQFPVSDGNSLIEANYQNRSIEQHAIADLDVSYVGAVTNETRRNGFTLPITCSCNGLGVTGCNKDLFSLGGCPVPTKAGSCHNPLRSNTNATTPDPFFGPCQNAAYTYPSDNRANSQDECQNGQIVCCVGTSCPPSYKQSKG